MFSEELIDLVDILKLYNFQPSPSLLSSFAKNIRSPNNRLKKNIAEETNVTRLGPAPNLTTVRSTSPPFVKTPTALV